MSYGLALSGELFCAEGGDERGMVLHGENEGGGNICIPIRERMAFGDAGSNTSVHIRMPLVEKVSYLESIKLICILLLRHDAKVFMFPLL